MTPEQLSFLQDLEADLMSPDPVVQLGLNGLAAPSISDATEALGKTISLVSQLPIDDARRVRLIQQTQVAYQSFLQELSSRHQADRIEVIRGSQSTSIDQIANPLATVSAGKVLLSLLGGLMGFLWSIPRFSFTTDGLTDTLGTAHGIAFVSAASMVWILLSLVPGALPSRSLPNRSNEGFWLAVVLCTWLFLVVVHQTWTAFVYADWFSTSSYDAFDRINNRGIFIANAHVGLLYLATFLLNSLVCVIVDKLLVLGEARPIWRLGSGVGIFLILPLLYGNTFYSVLRVSDQVRDVVLMSSALPLVGFLGVPLAAMMWANRRGLVTKPQLQLLGCVVVVTILSMVAAFQASPFWSVATVESRLPRFYKGSTNGGLPDSVAGEWLEELSRSYSGPASDQEQEEEEKDEALRVLLSRIEDPTGIAWPGRPFDEENSQGRTYRESAVTMLRAKGIRGPGRD